MTRLVGARQSFIPKCKITPNQNFLYQNFCNYIMTSKALLGRLSITHALSSSGRRNPSGSVIMLHGSCDNGAGMKLWLNKTLKNDFAFSNYKLLYPTAPTQQYTLMDGQMEQVWYDRLSLGPDMPENINSINFSAKALSQLIEEQSFLSGNKKVVIGGFSSGGTMALHMAYRFHPELIAGVFTLSSFLCPDSAVFQKLDENKEKFRIPKENAPECEELKQEALPPTPTLDKINEGIAAEKRESISNPDYPKLFMSQGVKDPLVKFPWAKSTFTKLREYGIEGEFYTFPKAGHGIEKTQLMVLHNWIENTLSPEKNDGPPKAKKYKRGFHVNDQIAIPAFDW